MVAEAVLQEGNVVREVKTPKEAFALLKRIFGFKDPTNNKPVISTDPSKELRSEKRNGDFEVRARLYQETDSDKVSGVNIIKERMLLVVKKRNGLEERYKLGKEGVLSYNASHRSIQLNGGEFTVDTPEYPRGGVTHFNNHDEGGQSVLLAIALAEEIRFHLERNV